MTMGIRQARERVIGAIQFAREKKAPFIAAAMNDRFGSEISVLTGEELQTLIDESNEARGRADGAAMGAVAAAPARVDDYAPPHPVNWEEQARGCAEAHTQTLMELGAVRADLHAARRERDEASAELGKFRAVNKELIEQLKRNRAEYDRVREQRTEHERESAKLRSRLTGAVATCEDLISSHEKLADAVRRARDFTGV